MYLSFIVSTSHKCSNTTTNIQFTDTLTVLLTIQKLKNKCQILKILCSGQQQPVQKNNQYSKLIITTIIYQCLNVILVATITTICNREIHPQADKLAPNWPNCCTSDKKRGRIYTARTVNLSLLTYRPTTGASSSKKE